MSGIVCRHGALALGASAQEPEGSAEGKKYFEPSLARTASGKFIPARTLMMDDYCLKCHEDAYKGWFHSAHHFQFVQQPALSVQRAGDAAGGARAGWQREGLALVRRLPRSGALSSAARLTIPNSMT